MTQPDRITADELRKLLTYDPASGNFTWLPREGDDPHTRTFNTSFAGKVAGNVHKKLGYRVIMIYGRNFGAHRLAFLFMTGKWPNAEVDHINLDRADNRFLNLRHATQAQNGANRTKYRNNTSGWKGASRYRSGWRAQIQVNGENIYLGTYRTPEEAHDAYCAAARQNFGEFARGE